ncbi:Hypothetical predicted protein, partial [Olea europaea subsp. europaea]
HKPLHHRNLPQPNPTIVATITTIATRNPNPNPLQPPLSLPVHHTLNHCHTITPYAITMACRIITSPSHQQTSRDSHTRSDQTPNHSPPPPPPRPLEPQPTNTTQPNPTKTPIIHGHHSLHDHHATRSGQNNYPATTPTKNSAKPLLPPRPPLLIWTHSVCRARGVTGRAQSQGHHSFTSCSQSHLRGAGGVGYHMFF